MHICATTVIAVKHKGAVAIAGDGQVTFGDTILKTQATKVRTVANANIITGFAGSTADALTLYEKFESCIKEYNGDMVRSAVEMAKQWRTDKVLRRLEAMLLCANSERILLISGNGDVIEPDNSVLAIGSGGNYALSAAHAFLQVSNYDAKKIAVESLKIAAQLCIYTNSNISVEVVK